LETFKDSLSTPCIIHRLFGSRFEGECLIFKNAKLKDNFSPFYHLLPITRTSIDRLTGTVAEKQLFTTEYVEPLEFFSEITGFHRNLTTEQNGKLPFEYSLLIAGIKNLRRIGADKSTGKGKLKIDINKIEYNNRRISIDEALAPFLNSDLKKFYINIREGKSGK